MEKDFEKVLISKEQLNSRIQELAKQLSKDYEGKNPLFICILKGSIFFTADLMRYLTTPSQIDFMCVSSYGSGTESSGKITVKKDLSNDISGKHVIIVEDIIDSGNTLSYLTNYLSSKNPASLKIITLLDKPERRKVPLNPDYTGFVIPDEFVVGYGLDYDEDYRAYPEICVLKREVYEK